MEKSTFFVEEKTKCKLWYLPSKGKDYRHRADGPAVEYADGTKAWYVDDKLHRIDGPAIERADGSKHWWVNDKRHRINKPAIYWPDGTKAWWVSGKRHRLDGPAIECADGHKEWWVDGRYLNRYEVENWITNNSIDLKTKEGQMAFRLKWDR